jgi:hypothetical protein
VAMEDVVNAAFVSHKLEQPCLYTSNIRNVALVSFREDVHRRTEYTILQSCTN